MATVRIVLTLRLHFQWSIHQLDVKNAFLHSVISELIFIGQPKGFTDPNYPNYVNLSFVEGNIGLGQAPQARFSRFSQFLIQQGFTICYIDSSLFVRHAPSSVTILLVYVDDILLANNDSLFMDTL